MEDISIVLEHIFQYQESVWHNRELLHPYINQYYTISFLSSLLMLNTLMELLHQSCVFLSTHVFVLFAGFPGIPGKPLLVCFTSYTKPTNQTSYLYFYLYKYIIGDSEDLVSQRDKCLTQNHFKCPTLQFKARNPLLHRA